MRKCWEMGGKMDLRIEKTERGIKNAFIELRSGKPFGKDNSKKNYVKAQESISLPFMRIIKISTICQMRWKKK